MEKEKLDTKAIRKYWGRVICRAWKKATDDAGMRILFWGLMPLLFLSAVVSFLAAFGFVPIPFFTFQVNQALAGLEDFYLSLILLFVLFVIMLWRTPAEMDNDKQKQIDDLSPAKPKIDFVFPPMQGKGNQKLEVINRSLKEVNCHAVFTYIAPIVFDNFRPYPSWWHSKNLVWSNRKTSDVNIVIDGNCGNAVLDIAETLDNRFNFLFQNGESVQVGFDLDDEYKKDAGLPEGVYLVNLRLDGKFEGKDFVVEKKYFVLFEIKKISKEKNIVMPIFQLQEAFEM